MSTPRPSLVRMAPAAALLALTAIAAPSAGATDYVVQAGYAAAGPHPALSATLHGAAAQPYALLAETNLLPGQGLFLGLGTLDDAGLAAHVLPYPAGLTGVDVRFIGVFAEGDAMMTAQSEALACDALFCDLWTFGYAPGGAALPAGLVITDQWASAGVHVSAMNTGGGPDKAILFDSSAPTGGDTDLVTPGYGMNHEEGFAYGMLLVVAENDNGELDGVVANPDDEAGGGILRFDWDDPVQVCLVTLLDVDEGGGADVTTWLDGGLLETFHVDPLDDNNLQWVLPELFPLDRLEVDFSGSGAVAQIDFLPCPRTVDFDTTTTGNPIEGLVAGLVVTDEFITQDVIISAVNNSGGPDKAVLFDTANPTGGDPDLMTPGRGTGNDTPEGLVLVIADSDAGEVDGVIPNPGDEGQGGCLIIDYSVCSRMEQATLLDIEEAGGFIELFDIDDESLGSFPIVPNGNNGKVIVDLGSTELVRRMKVNLVGSGALLGWRQCPTPGADQSVPADV